MIKERLILLIFGVTYKIQFYQIKGLKLKIQEPIQRKKPIYQGSQAYETQINISNWYDDVKDRHTEIVSIDKITFILWMMLSVMSAAFNEELF